AGGRLSALAARLSGWLRSCLSRVLQARLPVSLLVALAAVSLLAAVDALAASYYQQRVYPGVRIGALAVGGSTFQAVAPAVQAGLPSQPVHVVIGSLPYDFTPQQLGVTLDVAATAQRAIRLNRGGLALVAIARSYASAPIEPVYRSQAATLASLAVELAKQTAHPAVEARPLIVNGRALVLSAHSGQSLDAGQLADSMSLALKNGQRVVISTTPIAPNIVSSAYDADLKAATTTLALRLNLTLKGATISPSATDIGNWLSFGAVGSGVRVSSASLGEYLNAITPGFDRQAAQVALLAALTARQSLTYSANTKKTTVVAVDMMTRQPLAYRYCLAAKGADVGSLPELGAAARAALDEPNGWSLSGRLSFTAADYGCNMTLWLVAPSHLADFSSNCAGHTTCRVGNDLMISSAAWQQAPSVWAGSLAAYRNELINQEFGHWLGFTHARCGAGPSVALPVGTPTVHVAGCAPQWYQLPAGSEDGAALPGF
ncbi:MAG TPA: DUF3152 domain-containing protein, partial [Candidatus Saccharimonadia bacterium]|nr:DUF3152 domain-containing protein [Candidatus Saccharimonadia bacterium]